MDKIKKLIMDFLSKIFYNQVFEIRFGLAKGLKRRFGRGFKPRFFLTKEEKFLINLNLKEKTIFDVGGYIGVYSLFFARATGPKGKIFTFEPNPQNFGELIFNLKLNGFRNVTAYNLAVGDRNFEKILVEPIYPSRGSLSSDAQKKIISTGIYSSFTVEVNSVDSLIKNKKLLKPDFVKIDTEGFEMDILKGMKNTIFEYKPELLIELHGELKEEMLTFLLNNGYNILCIETNTNINSLIHFTRNTHLYCKV